MSSTSFAAHTLAAGLLIAALLCLAPPAAAATKDWIGGTGQWNVSGNWSPSGQPQAGDDVYLMQTDAVDRTVTYYNTTNPTALLNSVIIDATGTGTMTLDMPNPHLLTVYTEYIGASGKGVMTVRNGAQVSNTSGYLGFNSGSTGTATVTGAGSTWTNSGNLYVGDSGNGALSIQAAGQVANTDGYLGYNAGSIGVATVTGVGSKWTNSGYFHVGYSGNGTLNIEAGGQVSSAYGGSLGYYSGSTGTATVTGAGSTWTNSGSLYVGYKGSGTLTVADGGLVTAGTLYASLSGLLGDGTIAAQGAVLDTDLVFDAAHQRAGILVGARSPLRCLDSLC